MFGAKTPSTTRSSSSTRLNANSTANGYHPVSAPSSRIGGPDPGDRRARRRASTGGTISVSLRPMTATYASEHVEGRRIFDADSHVMELPGWLEQYADAGLRERLRPLYLGGAGKLAEEAIAA